MINCASWALGLVALGRRTLQDWSKGFASSAGSNLGVQNNFFFFFAPSPGTICIHLPCNADPGLINPPPYRSTRSTRSSEEVQKPNPPNNMTCLDMFGTRICYFAWYLLHWAMFAFHFACYLQRFGTSTSHCMVFATFWYFKRSCGFLESFLFRVSFRVSLGFHLGFL